MVVVGIAVLLAVLASVGAYKFLSGTSRIAEQARLQTVGIVVAQVDIPLGSTVNQNQVVVSPWPKDNYPKDALADTKIVVGRVALRDFLRGEPIVESKLVPLNKSTGLLSLKVPPGMRAFSIKVNEVVGVGGFIVPESRMDVIVTTNPSRSSPEKISKIVLEDVRVLAVGQVIEQKENKPVTVNTVTLALTPEDAEKLALAGNDGIIQLVMRNFSDNAVVMTGGYNKTRLLSSYRNAPLVPEVAPPKGDKPRRVSRKSPSPAAAPPPKKAYMVEVIKGNKRTEEKLD
jgi:pilus assembly protein CpaB